MSVLYHGRIMPLTMKSETSHTEKMKQMTTTQQRAARTEAVHDAAEVALGHSDWK